MRYDTAEDVALRLADTVCRLDGEPVWITQIPNDTKVTCYQLTDIHHAEIIDANSDRLDISSPPLGMLNQDTKGGNPADLREKSLFWTYRRSLRAQKQGLSNGNIMNDGIVEIETRRGATKATWRGMFADKTSLGKLIKGVYPSFEEIRNDFKEGFHRGMSRRAGLVYKCGVPCVAYSGFVVGLYDISNNIVTMSNKFKNDFSVKHLSDFMRVR